MATKDTITIDGRTVNVSNLSKVLYPQTRFTKGQVLEYYTEISAQLLPHLHDRPVTLKRFPDGVTGKFFYEKNAPAYTPEWVQRFSVPSRTRGSDIHYILINDLASLIWVANTANLEIHPFLHRAPHIERPTAMVFDFDPGEGADVLDCARAALLVRDLLAELKLECLAKVSGSKGLQAYVPLNGDLTYEVVRPFAKAIAELMEQRHPGFIVSQMSKELRSKKVFIDWSQNSDFKTTAGVYSLRAKIDGPFVSLPVRWQELSQAIKAGDARRLYFTPESALRRVKRIGDLFAPLLTMKQNLPEQIANAVAPPDPVPQSLRAYKAKRNFTKTAEPPPRVPQRSRQGSRRRFVIQKHAASHLHYDFRLEMQDVLKSWAVPKGPPLEPGVSRLAMATEDHPLAYLDFEGAIPKGQYGGGTVMVWDIGTYELVEGNYYKGRLQIYLQGKKLNGEWTLNRGKTSEDNKWYLVKSGAPAIKLSKTDDDRSALSGQSMEQIARAPARQWQSHRPSARRARSDAGLAPKSSAISAELPPELPAELKSLPKTKIRFVPPMLAEPVSSVPEGSGWQYEIKLDGYRALVAKSDTGVTIFSRRGNRLNHKFRGIATAFEHLAANTILDGEVVALDEQGRPSFSALQNVKTASTAGDQALYFYAFDLLAYQGRDLRGLPLSVRRKVLENFALRGLHDPVRISPTFESSAADLIQAVNEQGLEGIIAKRTDSKYQSGARTGAWVKYRAAKAEDMIIGGYVPDRYGFDSLLVGRYEGRKLHFVAKVRNGFTPPLRLAVSAKFKGLEIERCPFVNLPESKGARRGNALTRDAMKKCRWLRPTLAAHIEFAEKTSAKHLRHARFAGIVESIRLRKVKNAE